MVAPGCQQLAVLFLPDTRPLVRAEFKLPRGKTAVLVDDFMVDIEDAAVKGRIADRVIELLGTQRALRKVEFVSSDKLDALTTETPDGKLVSIRALGKQLGADTVIYVNITQFDLQSDPQTPLALPSGGARVKVIKSETGARLWPIDIAGRSIRVRGRREPETVEAKNRAKWTGVLVDMLAGKIAKLFYDHREET